MNTLIHSYTFLNLVFCKHLHLTSVSLFTAGCSPQNVSAEVSCLSNDLTISWDAVREADYFLVSVIADDGGISETLNTTNTAASISNVTCGRTFSVQATSVIGSCSSQHSHTVSALSGMTASKAAHSCINPSTQFITYLLFLLSSSLPAPGNQR